MKRCRGAPIEDDTLMALLVLAFAGQNVSVASGIAGTPSMALRRMERHAVRLIDEDGKLGFDRKRCGRRRARF